MIPSILPSALSADSDILAEYPPPWEASTGCTCCAMAHNDQIVPITFGDADIRAVVIAVVNTVSALPSPSGRHERIQQPAPETAHESADEPAGAVERAHWPTPARDTSNDPQRTEVYTGPCGDFTFVVRTTPEGIDYISRDQLHVLDSLPDTGEVFTQIEEGVYPCDVERLVQGLPALD